jgi:hypothetical protein
VVPLPCSNQRLLLIVALFPLAFVLIGFSLDSPQAIAQGLWAIVSSRDTLITDYMGLGGIGAALVQAGLLTLLAIACYHFAGAAIGGASVACLLLVLGFGLFGKSLINIWFIVLGVWCSRFVKRALCQAHQRPSSAPRWRRSSRRSSSARRCR